MLQDCGVDAVGYHAGMGDEMRSRAQEDFVSGLRKTVQWYLANRDWCAEVLADHDPAQRLGRGA